MDTILLSTGTYKVNASINGVTLDELSFFGLNDTIQPFFEDSISNDPDVTALIVFLKNSRGNIVGWKVVYTLEQIYKETNESYDVFSDRLSEGSNNTNTTNNTNDMNTTSNASNSNSTNAANTTNFTNNADNSNNLNTTNTTNTTNTINNADNSNDPNIANTTDSTNNADNSNTTNSSDATDNLNTTRNENNSNTNNPNDTEDDLEKDILSSSEENNSASTVVDNVDLQPVLNTDSFKNGDELIIVVKSLDGELPVFPLPDNLPIGLYTLVSQVMSGKDILQKIERSVYYMGKTAFSYDGIQVHMPGVTESTQVIPKEMVILLETTLNFDSRLNPYIIWYNGRRKISEGYFSDGAGHLLWKAPEQSGFYSLRAEVFPVGNFNVLLGYKNEISLLVSSKDIEVNLISENIDELLHWYTFEGNLNDSKFISSTEQAIRPDANNVPRWAGVNGTYGLVTSLKDVFLLPKVSVLNDGTETWQVLFRFKPLIDDMILSVQFNKSRDVFINLKTEDHNLVLELVSSLGTVSQTYSLQELSGSAGQSSSAGQDSFITAGIIFSIVPEMLAANISVIGDYINNSEFSEEWIVIEAVIESEFQIFLGHKSANDGRLQTSQKSEPSVIWDEFALYSMPPVEIFSVDEKEEVDENRVVDEDKAVEDKTVDEDKEVIEELPLVD